MVDVAVLSRTHVLAMSPVFYAFRLLGRAALDRNVSVDAKGYVGSALPLAVFVSGGGGKGRREGRKR